MNNELAPHQQRVIVEKEELDDKIKKLLAFTKGEIYRQLPADERDRLRRQFNLMDEYSKVLGERIDAFKQQVEAP